MREIYSDVIQFRGSYYDFGLMQGKLLKESFILKNRSKRFRKQKKRYTVKEKEARDALISLAPGIWEELMGLKDGLKWSMEDVLHAFGGYLRESGRSGCSVFTQSNYMVRNYDFHPFTYEGRFVLFQPTNQGYATIGPSQHITGRMDGMNEKGLSIAYNFVHRKKPGIGLIPNMVSRIVLETCSHTEEAITLLKEISHFHSFNYIILDVNEKAFIVEATPRNVEVRESSICTNHFEILQYENRYHLTDSFRRMDQILLQQGEIHDPYHAFQMFNETNRGVFSDNYKNSAGTIHTSVYFSKNKKVWFALGGDREPFVIDFQKWLQGEKMNVKRILGRVDTKLPFLHMNENVQY